MQFSGAAPIMLMRVSTDHLPKNVRLGTSSIMSTLPKSLIPVITKLMTLLVDQSLTTRSVSHEATSIASRKWLMRTTSLRRIRKVPASRIVMAETVVLRSLRK